MDILGVVDRGAWEAIGTHNNLPLAQTACIGCGQCATVCPVGAIVEAPALPQVRRLLEKRPAAESSTAGAHASSPVAEAARALDDGDVITVVQAAPAVRVTIGEAFGLPPGAVSTGQLVTALKAVGFDYVFDTNVC